MSLPSEPCIKDISLVPSREDANEHYDCFDQLSDRCESDMSLTEPGLKKIALSDQELEAFKLRYDPTDLLQNRRKHTAMRHDYEKLLAHIDVTLVQLLIYQKNLNENKEGKEAVKLNSLAEQLRSALYLSCMQFYLNHIESRTFPQEKLEKNILKYQLLLDLINASKYSQYTQPVWVEQARVLWPPRTALEEKSWELWIKEEWKSFNQHRIHESRRLLSKVNDFRGDYVWTGTLLKAFVNLWNKAIDKDNQERLKRILEIPGLILTVISLSLRYLRFLLTLLSLLKHVIKHPWMKKEEQDIDRWERLRSQLEQRKFGLITEGMWTLVSTLTSFCLKTGIANQLLVVGMLCTELVINYIEWNKAEKTHQEAMTDFTNDWKTLASQRDALLEEKKIEEHAIAALMRDKLQHEKEVLTLRKRMAKSLRMISLGTIDGNAPKLSHRPRGSVQKKESLSLEIKNFDEEIARHRQKIDCLEKSLAPILEEMLTLEKIMKTRHRAWHYQRLRHQQAFTTMMIAIAAFIFAISAMVPHVASLPAVLILGGPILSFTLTAFSNAVALGIDQAELTAGIKNVREEFSAITKANHELTLIELTQLKELFVQEIKYDVERSWKKAHMWRGIGSYTIIPAVYFGSMLCTPFGISIGLTIACIGLAIAAYCLIWHRHTVQKNHVDVVKEKIESQLNSGAPSRWFSEPENVHGFFAAIDKRKEIAPYLTPDLQPVVGY